MEIQEVQDNVKELFQNIWKESRSAVRKTERDVSNFIKECVDKGRLSPADGRKIVKSVGKKMRKNRDEIERWFGDRSRHALGKINIPTKGEVERLSRRVNSLSRRINSLKKQLAN